MSEMAQNEDLAVAERGGIVENAHRVHAAVIDSSGKLLYAVGNPHRIIFPRSTAKPAQALAVLETGGVDQFGFDEADLALMCASHSSEDRHISRALAMLVKVNAEEKDLRCGGHPSLSEAVNRAWAQKAFSPTAACNDCSGKHVGMLAGARAINAGIEDYHLPGHPMQLRVKRTIEELCGSDAQWAIDGCNLPALATPLCNTARIYAALANATDAVGEETSTPSPARTQHLARIFYAMTLHPELVGGEGRFCTVLMNAFEGILVGKVGSDGCYGIGIRKSGHAGGVGRAVGISIKVEDGNPEIVYAAAAEILEQLQVGTPDMRRKIDAFRDLKRLNTVGVEAGRVSLQFRLRAMST